MVPIDPPDTLSHTSATMPKTPENPDPNAPNAVAQFEQSLDELESLVQRMEKGDLSLDESLAAYERGVGLYRRCQTALEQAELRVRLLTDPLDPDSAEPFDAPE
jgi:exodeoxyribonuclease VII small subunit